MGICKPTGFVHAAVGQRSAPHEYVSRFRDKEKFIDVTPDDMAPVMDFDAPDTDVRCLESMNDDEIDRLKAFVLAVWMFTVTSLSACRGKRGIDPKGTVDHREAEDDDGRRLYTSNPWAQPMDVTCAPETACRTCKNAGRGLKHQWLHECPGFD